jgi:hypothetical protein
MNYIFKKLLVILLFINGFIAHSQTLTVSESGDAGPTSGTNWSISNGQLYYTANANVQASVITTALANGSLNIQAISNNVSVDINQDIITTNSNALSIGNSNSEGTVTFNRTVDIGGALTVHANKINMGDAPVVSVGESAQIITRNGNHTTLLAKNGFETVADANCVRGKITTVGGGNIHISADADNNNTGILNIDWLTIDHTTGSLLLEGASFNWNIGNTSPGGHCPLPEIYGSGSITFRPTTNNSTQNFHTSWISLIGNKASLTFGSSTNNFQNIIIEPCTSCLGTPINGSGQTITTANGPIEAHGFVIEIRTNLKTIGSGDDILLRAQRRLQIFDGTASTDYRSLQTNNGDIVLWTNSINDIPGGVVIGDWVTLNSANGSTNQTTGGGRIWIAGGSAVNADGLPTGPANGGDIRCGVSLGTFSPGATTTSIYSGGGYIYINGESNGTLGNGLGVTWNRTGICHSGNGVITIKGEAKNTNAAHGVELGAYSGTMDMKCNGGDINTTAITIDGITASTSNIDYAGIQLPSGNIQATGSGGVILKGLAPNKNYYSAVVDMNVLAASGNILLSTEGGTGLFYGGTLGKLAGSDVTISSSNVTLRSNQITVNNEIAVDATGTLVVEPFGTSFTNALSWPIANFTLASGISGLTLGKAGNTANVTIGAAQAIDGPINIYGGNISINQNLTTTASDADILLQGSGILQAAGVKVETYGGDIDYEVTNAPWTSGDDRAITIGNIGTTAQILAHGGNINLSASFGPTGTSGGSDRAIWINNSEVVTTGTGEISLVGDATNNGTTTVNAWGIAFENNGRIQTNSGALTLDGTGGKSNVNSRGVVIDGNVYRILSSSGNINIFDRVPLGLTGTYTGLYFKSASTSDLFIGADGSNVPSTSNVVIQADRFFFDESSSNNRVVNFNTAGTITIAPLADDFAIGVNLSNLNATNATALTIGKESSADGISDVTVTVGSATTTAGPITIYGGGIVVNENLNTTAGGANGDVLLKSSGLVNLGSGKSINTNGGDVTFWADSDGNGSGYIQTSGGANSGIVSGGGDIFLGGGTTLATGYARGAAVTDPALFTNGVNNIYISGVHLRDETNINSGGGNITMRGQNVGDNQSRIQFGIMGHNATVNAGNGKISLNGLAGGSGGFGAANAQGISNWGNGWVIRSSNPDADAIRLVGDASMCDNANTSLGINFTGTIEATGGGGVYLYGKSSTASVYDQPLDVYGDILANSGTITIEAENDVATQTSLFLSGATIGSKAATNVTTSTSDVILKSDNTVFNSETNINTSGAVSIAPLDASNSFGVLQTLGYNLVLSNNISGLTIGKPSNTANVAIAAAQTIAGPITVYGDTITLDANLTTTNNGSIHLKGNTTIAAGKTITSGGDFTQDGDLTFKSDLDGTAAFGPLGGTFTKVSGITTVERYVPARRAWRLLTSPLKGNSGGSIFANWQGTNNEGILLWGPQGTATPTSSNSGMYQGPQANIWSHTGTAWSSVGNTNTTQLFDANGNNAFLVFATGSHGSGNIASEAAATTIRARGSLITGSVSHTLTADQYKLIGNPYASPIDTEALATSNPGSKIWLVDPSLGTLGGYVTHDGSNWSIPIAPTPSGNDRYIQSGQGFFVRSASETIFTITESHKVSGNSNTWFERNANSLENSESTDRIRVLLYKQEDNQWKLADGILAVNSAGGNDEVDEIDSGKISNFNESLMFRNSNTNLSIEYRDLPSLESVQPMRLTGTTSQSYQLRVYTENYNNSNLQPVIEDTQTGTFTPIPMNGEEIIIPFSGIVASASQPDMRFRIVFQSILSIAEFTEIASAVYPNPVQEGWFTVELKNMKPNTSYTLSNLLGQEVQSGFLEFQKNQILINKELQGVYLLKLTQDGKSATTKLIIK